MDSAKRLVNIGIVAVVALLTTFVGQVNAAGCLIDIHSSWVEKGGFRIECVKVNEGVSVQVTCRSDDWASFPDFQVNLAYVAQTHFINCSYASSPPLIDIFRRMNLNKSGDIYFKNLGLPPNRQYFQNISVSRVEITESKLTELPFDMLYDVSGLEYFVMQDTSLVRIPQDFFKHSAQNLKIVDLLNNKLEQIGKDDFARLSNLQELILHGNDIAEIQASAFDDLSSLEVLDLSNNRLHSFPSGIFRHLSKLKRMSLGQNPFDQLPNDLLTTIQDCHLQTFRMNSLVGTLKTLPPGFFKKLTYLTEVQLQNNLIENLPSDLFDETLKLGNLNLKSNSLETLPASFFSSLEKLKTLDLSNNEIVSLPPDIFEKLFNLTDLDISYNNLTTLESDVLRGLANLKKFNASNNDLTKVDHFWCRNLQSIETIDLSYNGLSLGSDGTSIFIQCPPTLENIHVSHNNATEIMDDLGMKIKYIDWSYNNVTELTTEQIYSLVISTELMDLRNNQISKISLTNLSSLVNNYKAVGNHLSSRRRVILIGNNPLHCDCDLIDLVRYWNSEHNSELRQYVKLTASNDGSDASMTCASPPEFKGRDLRNIRPEELSCVLKTDALDQACTNTCSCREYPAKQVLSVDCSYRNLTQLPAKISNVHNWSIELNMSHNVLTQTPSQDFYYLTNVTILDLSNNNISTVSMDILSINLLDLRLHNNSISRLDHAVIKHLANSNTLHTLTLHQNPWLCDCQAHSFLNFIQKKTPIYRLDKVMCSGTSRKLYKMTVADVCQNMIAIVVGASLFVAFLGLVIGILAALYYKYQKEIKIWLYAKQWCLWFVTEDELDQDKKYDAFVSFSHKDEDFVEREIVAKLEDGPRPYKLCLHYRDWLAGEWIPVQISQSVEESRRTIVVLSPNFLESVWGRLEFRTAHTQALKEGRARVIIILYGEIENMQDLDPELKSYLSLNTYLKWGDPWFWDKLRYALPHRSEPSRRRSKNARIIEDHLMRQPVNNDSANAIAKSDVLSMSKLTNDSAKLLDSGVDERTVASC